MIADFEALLLQMQRERGERTMENQKEDFKFTYSAKEQEELRKIRQKYQPQEEDKMERLRKLDASVTQKATAVSISIGIIGSLIMGTGMSLIMTNLGESIGLYGMTGMIVAIIVGMIGMVFIGCAYPVYNRVIKKEREKIAPEILRLTDELIH